MDGSIRCLRFCSKMAQAFQCKNQTKASGSHLIDRWFTAHDFVVQYRPVRMNPVADALSRQLVECGCDCSVKSVVVQSVGATPLPPLSVPVSVSVNQMEKQLPSSVESSLFPAHTSGQLQELQPRFWSSVYTFERGRCDVRATKESLVSGPWYSSGTSRCLVQEGHRCMWCSKSPISGPFQSTPVDDRSSAWLVTPQRSHENTIPVTFSMFLAGHGNGST